MMESAERSRGVSSVSARSSASLGRNGARGGAEWTSAAFAQAVWRKSSWSSFNGNCVEVGELPGGRMVGVRDTKDSGPGPVLVLSGAAWRSFIDSLKAGSVIH